MSRPGARHRREVRPRWGRIAVVTAALGTTVVALLGGVGALPGGVDEPAEASKPPVAVETADPSPVAAESPAARPVTPGVARAADRTEVRANPAADTTLPAQSGEGRRVVFSESRQRVWLVEAGGAVRRTYPVSGSIYDNLDPGTYEVYSRSEQAWGIDDSGTMKYFVRFTRGERAAIGFHDIPIHDGRLVQEVSDLGTPQSHGCIRQRRGDAIALWRFAPLGTTVVVTA